MRLIFKFLIFLTILQIVNSLLGKYFNFKYRKPLLRSTASSDGAAYKYV